MLIVLIKSVVTFLLVFFFIRLMGKRQLGEMQPLELVITLIIAEVACIPMNDPYIPFYYGVIPIVTLAFLHVAFSFLSRKSMIVRRILSGRSVIAIDKDGINYESLKKMNMNVNDLLEAVRSGGYADIKDIAYAIFETNGKLCVVEQPQASSPPKEPLLPLPLVIDGKFIGDNLDKVGVSEAQITKSVKSGGVGNIKQVLYADIRQDGTLYVSPKNSPCFTKKMSITGGQNW